MGDFAFGRAVGIVIGAGLLWAAIGFGGYALNAALEPNLGLVWAAAVTAAVLSAGAAIVFAVFARRRPQRLGDLASDTILATISTVGRDRPLLAVFGAILFGAAEVLLRTPRKK